MKKIALAIVVVMGFNLAVLLNYELKKLDEPIIVGQLYDENAHTYYITYIDNKDAPRSVNLVHQEGALTIYNENIQHDWINGGNYSTLYPIVKNVNYGVYVATLPLYELQQLTNNGEQIEIYFSDHTSIMTDLHYVAKTERSLHFEHVLSSMSSDGSGQMQYVVQEDVTIQALSTDGPGVVIGLQSEMNQRVVYPIALKKGDRFTISFKLEEGSFYHEKQQILMTYIDSNGNEFVLEESVYKPFQPTKEWIKRTMEEL